MRRHPLPLAVSMPDGRAPHPGVVIGAEVRLYAGAGHSFSAPWGPLRHDEADRAAWDDAVAFLPAHTEG